MNIGLLLCEIKSFLKHILLIEENPDTCFSLFFRWGGVAVFSDGKALAVGLSGSFLMANADTLRRSCIFTTEKMLFQIFDFHQVRSHWNHI